MEWMEWLSETETGAFVLTILLSTLPVAELRLGVPFGVALGLPPLAALAAGVLGNLLPLPFLVAYTRRVFHFLRRRLPRLDGAVDALERKAHLKGRLVHRYQYLGLALLVAIPLPGTGGWTGALVAALLDMPLRKALPALSAGVCLAGGLVCVLTHGLRILL